MKKIKEYKGIIIIVLVLILGAFYWFQIRPSFIRKDCYKIHFVSTVPGLSYERYLLEKNNPEIKAQESFGEKAYQRCLYKNGLIN